MRDVLACLRCGTNTSLEAKEEFEMLNRTKLLLATTALASSVSVAPAMAEAPVGFAGNAAVSYSNLSVDDFDDSADTWSVQGSGAFGFSEMFAGQLDLNYNNLSVEDEDLDVWGIGGALFWNPIWGRLGASLHYNAASVDTGFGDLDIDLFQYGAFGEWFAGNFVTLGAKAGGVSYSFDDDDSESGWYVGGALTGYLMPNLALNGNVDFIGLSDVDLDMTNYGIGAEFLVSQTLPISVFGGYTRSNIDAGGFDLDSDIWSIGVRIYTNGNGVTLVERHRNGAVGAIGNLATGSLFLF
jgi:hypothetical protein